MKTKTQLEKEIEELEREYNYEGKSKYNKLNQLKTTLTQTNAIIELIEKMEGVDAYFNEMDNKVEYDDTKDAWLIDRDKLLTKIKGEEK